MRFSLLVIISVAIGLRYLFFSFGFYDVLGYRKEVVTPVSDVKRGKLTSFKLFQKKVTIWHTLVTEGLFLLKLGQNPYAGDTFHNPPLMLLPFYLLNNNPAFIQSLYIALDILIALILVGITSTWQARLSKVTFISYWIQKEMQEDLKRKEEERQYNFLRRKTLPELVAFLYNSKYSKSNF